MRCKECNGKLKSSVCLNRESDASGCLSFIDLEIKIKCEKCGKSYYDYYDILEQIIDQYLEEL